MAMTESEISMMKGIIARVNALTATIINNDELIEEYNNNLIVAKKDLDSRIGGAYLQSAFEGSPDDPTPPQQ